MVLSVVYFSNVENCRPATACVVDMYIDDKANLPWNNKARYASMYGRKSNVSYGHSILMINLLIFIAEPNAVSNISWGWIYIMFMAKDNELVLISYLNTIEISTKTRLSIRLCYLSSFGKIEMKKLFESSF
ncbi:hypothetical protein BSPWISOXPB_7014 [uncultured Gammaproteobacteria bacterium]|nr:hypothetical protein BSPWISOXPB_7014 [uncultured Gammaproteobacteria bacterium]